MFTFFQAGRFTDHLVMSLGHTLMFVFMALVMVRRRAEYTHHRHPLGISSA